MHTGNKTYRKFFEEYTSKKLPGTNKGTTNYLKEATNYVEPEKVPVVKTPKMTAEERLTIDE